MSQNKRRKMDLGAACSSTSVNTQEMSTNVLDDGGEPHIAQQTSRANYSDGSGFSNANEENDIFLEYIVEFREAVKWTGFVDKSLLIKELLSKRKAVIIFAPKRFGKSMNLNMVKRFFEIEGDRDVTNAPQDLAELEKYENFQAFHRYELKQPCKIMGEADFVKQYFGRHHPVLHICFKDVKVSSFQDVENSVREIVHFAYLAHSYLQYSEIFSHPIEKEQAKKTCRIWCDEEKYINKGAIGGLQKLIQYLHAYHKRKVYLLVDEFDAPAVDALLERKSGDEVMKISNEVTKLLGAILKGEVTRQHLLGSLITGVSYLGSVGISGHLNDQPIYKWLLDEEGRFAPYYGLSHDELTTLLKHVFPNQEQQQKRDSIEQEVKDLYNGYNFRGEFVYSLWSVLHYIEKRSRWDVSNISNTTFWGGSSIVSKMSSLLEYDDIMEEIINLMGDDCISFKPCETVDAGNLADYLNGIKSPDPNIILSFFMEQGYLTRVPDQREKVYRPNKEIRVKIPNADVLVAFQEMFHNFAFNCCGLSNVEMRRCADVFKDMPIDRDDEICKKKLGDLYNHVRSLLQVYNGKLGVKERSLQTALFAAMLKGNFDQCWMEKPVTVGRQSGKIDLWVSGENFAIIYEMKYIESDNDDLLKNSAQQALKKILYVSGTKKVPYVIHLDEYSNIKNYFLIGISMNNKGKPCMCCVVNSRNDKDCLVFPEDE